MQFTRRRFPPREALEMPAAELNRRRNHGSSLRTRLACTCSGRPGSARCVRHGYIVPSREKLIRRASDGNREILKRALMPSSHHRMSHRRWNFRPTPSRLCNMSSAWIFFIFIFVIELSLSFFSWKIIIGFAQRYHTKPFLHHVIKYKFLDGLMYREDFLFPHPIR